MLREFKKTDPNYYPILVNELKNKLLQWQDKRKINPLDCPEQIKQALWEISETLENG